MDLNSLLLQNLWLKLYAAPFVENGKLFADKLFAALFVIHFLLHYLWYTFCCTICDTLFAALFVINFLLHYSWYTFAAIFKTLNGQHLWTHLIALGIARKMFTVVANRSNLIFFYKILILPFPPPALMSPSMPLLDPTQANPSAKLHSNTLYLPRKW